MHLRMIRKKNFQFLTFSSSSLLASAVSTCLFLNAQPKVKLEAILPHNYRGGIDAMKF